MFAVEEKPIEERVQLSQSKHELILKCSFNQRDCDIEKYDASTETKISEGEEVRSTSAEKARLFSVLKG